MRTMFMSAQFLLKIYNLFTALQLPMTNLSRVICNDLGLLKKKQLEFKYFLMNVNKCFVGYLFLISTSQNICQNQCNNTYQSH